MNVYRFLFLKCINIAGDIQVIVVVTDFLKGRAVAVFLYLFAFTVGVDNLFDVLRP